MAGLDFKVGGRGVTPERFFEHLQEEAIEMALRELEERARGLASSLVDPETGKHPTVFVRRTSETGVAISTRGSPAYARELEHRLGVDKGAVRSMRDLPLASQPSVYLAHGSPDHSSLAKPLAEKMMADGISVWLDEWEIGPGDSLRQRMDEGLGQCTHFIVLLTKNSIGRPWVESEIDVGFARAVESRSKFIGLRIGVQLGELSPFLQSRHCPALDPDDEQQVAQLVADVHGVSRKPPVGAAPRYVKSVPEGLQFYAPATIAVAEYLVRHSEYGTSFDPQVGKAEVALALGLPVGDVSLAVLDLKDAGLIEESASIGSDRFYPKASLFVEFDRHFMDFNNEEDAIALASWLVSSGNEEAKAPEIAAAFPDWSVRQLNSALGYLDQSGVVDGRNWIGQGHWVVAAISVTDRTRRFVRDHG